MTLIPPQFLDCVVAIGFDTADGKRQYAATGFLYGNFLSKDKDVSTYEIFLVTNKHVFKDQEIASLRFNPSGSEPAREYALQLIDENKKQKWLPHPDPNIDLATIKINAPFLKEQGIRFSFFQSDQNIVTRSSALELGLSEGDGVFVLGFPMGLVGEKRNFVIVRQGIIARIRDYLEHNGKEILIDTTIFPGNSGGPVINRPEIVSIQGTKSIGSVFLIGVVSSYLTYQDVAVSTQTMKPRIIFEENSGLASIVPIDYLVEMTSKTDLDKSQTDQKLQQTE